MDKKFSCYCGLCCENCAVKVRVNPAARVLFDEMTAAGFGDVVAFIPDGEAFWRFLTEVAENWGCTSCRDGCGDPGCRVRVCAREKNVEMCAFCSEYPCATFNEFAARHRYILKDNELLRTKGWDAWLKLQDERRAEGYVLQEAKNER